MAVDRSSTENHSVTCSATESIQTFTKLSTCGRCTLLARAAVESDDHEQKRENGKAEARKRGEIVWRLKHEQPEETQQRGSENEEPIDSACG